jgi:hypothetical protein
MVPTLLAAGIIVSSYAVGVLVGSESISVGPASFLMLVIGLFGSIGVNWVANR